MKRAYDASRGRLQLFGPEPVRKMRNFIAACSTLRTEIGPCKTRDENAAGQNHPAGDDLKYDCHDDAPNERPAKTSIEPPVR